MRFHQLSVGQRFQLDGVNYIKTSPLIASDARTGWQKFMARSASVTVVDQQAPRRKRAIEPELAQSAVRRYHARVVACLDGVAAHLERETLDRLKGELDAARRACLETLLEEHD
ncbi:MAG: hypothetical protein P8124_10960 [Gammaproteobacteria bacterium]